MRRVVTVIVMGALALGLASCGNTNNDELVLTFLNLDGEMITQCDTVDPGEADVDVVQGICGAAPDFTAEPFTQTTAIANFQNNQLLDLRLTSYQVEIENSGLGVFTGNPGGQVLQGKRCTNETSRACATDADCLIEDTIGTCAPSESSAEILLFDFTTKSLIVPQVAPAGKTLPVLLTFFASDASGENLVLHVNYQARFDNFDNCACALAQ